MGLKDLMSNLFGKSTQFFPDNTPGKNGTLFAPVKGKMIPLEQVPDPVFAKGMLGKGVAFEPAEGVLYAPCDGTISVFFPTGHAIGINTNDGAEILMHVGMDTVSLQGKGFTTFAKQGDVVKKGQLLLKFDIEFITSKSLSVVTPMVITNSAEFENIQTSTVEEADNNTEVITY